MNTTAPAFKTDKHHIYSLRVNFEDVDLGGVVHHPNYLKYMERARTSWLNSEGIDYNTMVAKGHSFVVRDANLQYLKPARFNDLIAVHCRVTTITKTSCVFVFEVRHQADSSKLYCTATLKLVCINEQLKPTALPDYFLEVIR